MEISKERLINLLKAEAKLDFLEGAGVDNWEWFGEALHGDDLESSYSEICEDIEKECEKYL